MSRMIYDVYPTGYMTGIYNAPSYLIVAVVPLYVMLCYRNIASVSISKKCIARMCFYVSLSLFISHKVTGHVKLHDKKSAF